MKQKMVHVSFLSFLSPLRSNASAASRYRRTSRPLATRRTCGLTRRPNSQRSGRRNATRPTSARRRRRRRPRPRWQRCGAHCKMRTSARRRLRRSSAPQRRSEEGRSGGDKKEPPHFCTKKNQTNKISKKKEFNFKIPWGRNVFFLALFLDEAVLDTMTTFINPT